MVKNGSSSDGASSWVDGENAMAVRVSASEERICHGGIFADISISSSHPHDLHKSIHVSFKRGQFHLMKGFICN